MSRTRQTCEERWNAALRRIHFPPLLSRLVRVFSSAAVFEIGWEGRSSLSRAGRSRKN
jgi:hypothetical protein